jgi:DNA invertase Pin-like site-specific DNA recombinase
MILKPREAEMPGMIVGYARTSTADQAAGLEGQERDLHDAGAERVFSEQTSALGHRPQLDEALRFVRDGDTLIVTKPDRLARSTADLLRLIEELNQRHIGLVILSMNGEKLDTRSPTSRLLITMLGAISQFERELMLERQREGIRKAKTEGKYRGRIPTARRQSAAVLDLHAQKCGPREIARQLGISRASVHRIINDAKGQETIAEAD